MRRQLAHRVPIAVVSMALAASLGGCFGSGGEDEPEPAQSDLVIVSVGDSVASGEGNPAPKRPHWFRPSRCHRSRVSGQRFAAEGLIRDNPEAALHFVSYACSGATVDEGLLGPQRPRRFQPTVPPQLDRLDDLIPRTTVEALMISVGANDVGFSNIVTFCVIEEPCVQSRDFAPAKQWAKKQHQPVPTLDAFVRWRLSRVRENYAKVDARIPAEVDDRVLIVEYFDPTRSPAGSQCPIFRTRRRQHPERGRVSIGESTWAHDHVLVPLNEAIRDAAGEYGWTLVEGVDERFDGHGICGGEDQRWVVTLHESLNRQGDHRGTLHPNAAGHGATAELIRPQLEDVLDLEDEGQ